MLRDNWTYRRGDVYERHEFRWFKIGSTYRISKKSFDEWLDSKL